LDKRTARVIQPVDAQAPGGVATRPSGIGVPLPATVSKPPRKRYRKSEVRAGFWFLFPSAIHFLTFEFGMVILSAYMSLTQWDLFTPPDFIGIKNYVELLDDRLFWISLRNTVYWVVLVFPASIALPLALALAVNTKIRGITIFRTAYFLPVVASMVAVAVIFRWLYNPDFGLLNWFLGLVGIDPVDWLQNRATVMPALAAMSVWKGLGWNMTLFLAGLQAIPFHLYEAARIDGARKWSQFWHITWPLLSPTTFFVSVMTVIGSFQVFDAIYLMTGGGPGRTTTVYGYYLWVQGFREFHMGYAAAMAWFLFAVIAVLTYAQFRFLNRRVNYELG
jgi:multiple sugar transport system permease protein